MPSLLFIILDESAGFLERIGTDAVGQEQPVRVGKSFGRGVDRIKRLVAVIFENGDPSVLDAHRVILNSF